MSRCLRLRALRCFLRRSRTWAISQNIERVTRLTAEHLHYADASLTRRRRHAAFEILWQRLFVDYFIHCIILRLQMHDAFQSRLFFLNQDLFYRETKKRRRWRDFFIVKRLLSVDIELIERRLLNIFEIYRVQNRFRASYVRNFIFFDYADFALKWLNRMIVFTINTFFFVDRYLARWIIVRLDTNWTSSLISTNLVDVIILLTIKTLLDSTIVNKQFARYLRVLVQKIVFYQTINLFNALIFIINDDNSFSSLMTFFDQITFAILKLECKISFCFSMRRIIFCWLLICTSIIHISWINISKILDIAYVDEATFFIKKLLIINRFLIFFERVINFTFSLKRRFVVITFFFSFFRFVADV